MKLLSGYLRQIYEFLIFSYLYVVWGSGDFRYLCRYQQGIGESLGPPRVTGLSHPYTPPARKKLTPGPLEDQQALWMTEQSLQPQDVYFYLNTLVPIILHEVPLPFHIKIRRLFHENEILVLSTRTSTSLSFTHHLVQRSLASSFSHWNLELFFLAIFF